MVAVVGVVDTAVLVLGTLATVVALDTLDDVVGDDETLVVEADLDVVAMFRAPAIREQRKQARETS